MIAVSIGAASENVQNSTILMHFRGHFLLFLLLTRRDTYSKYPLIPKSKYATGAHIWYTAMCTQISPDVFITYYTIFGRLCKLIMITFNTITFIFRSKHLKILKLIHVENAFFQSSSLLQSVLAGTKSKYLFTNQIAIIMNF